MSLFGERIRSRYPGVYKRIVGLINRFISATRPYSIFITDNLGGSFKTYFSDNNMEVKIEALKKGLDTQSAEVVEVIIQRLLAYPDGKNKVPVSRSEKVVGGLLPVETEAERRIIDQYLRAKASSVKLPKGMMDESVFYFYHGLRLLPREVEEYVKGHHFLDIGAFVGDSAIALREYQYNKIYSLEISLKSIDRYRANMVANNIAGDKHEILNVGVASSDDEPPLKMFDTGSAGFSLYRKAGKYDEIEINRKSLDWIVNQNGIQPRFIKVDIEGAAMDFVKGARKTLTTFRPVLSVAIYHNPIEFFEVKPALEAMLPNYRFTVRKLSSAIRNNQIHSEVVLLAYPLEVMSGDVARMR